MWDDDDPHVLISFDYLFNIFLFVSRRMNPPEMNNLLPFFSYDQLICLDLFITFEYPFFNSSNSPPLLPMYGIETYISHRLRVTTQSIYCHGHS